jgi:hypothetical protein
MIFPGIKIFHGSFHYLNLIVDAETGIHHIKISPVPEVAHQ